MLEAVDGFVDDGDRSFFLGFLNRLFVLHMVLVSDSSVFSSSSPSDVLPSSVSLVVLLGHGKFFSSCNR